jgi:hypothetical protein
MHIKIQNIRKIIKIQMINNLKKTFPGFSPGTGLYLSK